MAEIVFAAGAAYNCLIGLLEAAPTDIKDIVVTSRANRRHSIEPANLQHSVTH